jgi:hypothetical protein
LLQSFCIPLFFIIIAGGLIVFYFLEKNSSEGIREKRSRDASTRAIGLLL